MKSKKLAGIRLFNYLNDGINWKDHKDIILDYWIKNIAPQYNRSPDKLQGFVTVESLPTAVQKEYEDWFKKFDFQTSKDQKWIDFVNGTLNIFYHTKGYRQEPKDIWYIDLMKSEVKARNIVESQVYHGNPNLNSFMKIETNSKPEEVGGRRNGYIYARKLASIRPRDTQGYYWGVIFTCDETVSIKYDSNGHPEERSICWAANPEHITLVKITADGLMVIVPCEVKKKLWMDRRVVPEGMITKTPMNGARLAQYLKKNFNVMYGIFDNIKKRVDEARVNATARKNALCTMSDEEIMVGEVLGMNPEDFVENGHVSPKRLEYNRAVRRSIHHANVKHRQEVNAKMRAIEKEERRKSKEKAAHFNALV